MKIIEIRNNLVKFDFENADALKLGLFVVLTFDQGTSYVGQVINLKTDDISNKAIAKLIFTFSKDGIVDNYDGSIPDIRSKISLLPVQELLDLLPVENPIYMGHLAQQDEVLKIDISVFEHNFTIFSDRDEEKKTFISNCVNQLAKMNEKSVIFDSNNIFDNFPKLRLGEDFKIPLNSDLIDYILDYELADINISTKAVIRDIFYAVQKYIDTLEHKFLPIDKFVEVVNSQYEQTHIPELAILKSKLLKYKDLNIFANKQEELNGITSLLGQNNALIIDLLDINPKLQSKVINVIYNDLNLLSNYIYMFLPLSDENSDKKLLRRLINHTHIFTTIFVNHSYKYALELKEHAQNLAFFAPQTMQHEFATYNTFLNKLNHNEYVLYGKLTQNVPFIVTSSVYEENEEDNLLLKRNKKSTENIEIKEPDSINSGSEDLSTQNLDFSGTKITEIEEEITDNEEEYKGDEKPLEIYRPADSVQDSSVEPVGSISEDAIVEEEPFIDDIFDNSVDVSDSLEDGEDILSDEILTEDDLDYIDENIEDSSSDEVLSEEYTDIDEPIVEESTPVVPVYPVEDDETELSGDDIDFNQGDSVNHPRYGQGTIEKIIKYGNKTLCSIYFENVGRRLLDPSISEFEKV